MIMEEFVRSSEKLQEVNPDPEINREEENSVETTFETFNCSLLFFYNFKYSIVHYIFFPASPRCLFFPKSRTSKPISCPMVLFFMFHFVRSGPSPLVHSCFERNISVPGKFFKKPFHDCDSFLGAEGHST